MTDYLKNLSSDTEFAQLLQDATKLGDGIPNFDSTKLQTAELVTRDIPRGVFALLTPTWSNEDSASTMQRYKQTINIAFENSLLHNRVLETSNRDGLTGLHNVRFFKERFVQEIGLAHRHKYPLSLIFLDIDHFKKYNDTHGHPAGDQILKQFALIMQQEFRKTDILARYGGEEFVILLSHAPFSSAIEKAESFRKIIEDTPFPFGDTQPLGKISASIGVSEYPSHGSDMDTVIKAADDALYAAKKRSRNVVVSGIAAEGYVPPF